MPEAVALALHGEAKASVEGRDAVGTAACAAEGLCPDVGSVVYAGLGGHEVAESVSVWDVVFAGSEDGFGVFIDAFFDNLSFHVVEEFRGTPASEIADCCFETDGVAFNEPHGDVYADYRYGEKVSEEVGEAFRHALVDFVELLDVAEFMDAEVFEPSICRFLGR